MENSINRSSNATSVLNGFLFQIDVAIFLFIEYIDDIEIMRVEGKKEDIEITLKNKNKYMVQVKSQYNAQTKNKNIMARLRKALRGLIKSDSEEVERLIYATNFVDPLNNNDPEFLNYSYILRKNYIDLSDSSRKVIEEEINKIIESKHIDYNKIWLVRIPFSGEDEREKHKFIHEQVKFFLKGIYDGLDYYKFVKDWESILMNNGANISTKSITRNDMKTNLIFVCLQGKQPYIKYSSLGVNENDFDEACSRYNE